MRSVLKIGLGVCLGGILLLALVVVLISAAVSGSTSSTSSAAEPTADTTTLAARKPRTIDRATATGDYAIAQASGRINHPATIRVRVNATPHQKADVAWTLVCNKGTSAGSKSGQFHMQAPGTRALKKPASNNDSCVVSANAQLSRGGKVTITLTG